MIKANELRLGNVVLLGKDYQHIYQIIYDRMNGYSINHKDYKEEYFEPIPLTEEILIASGFASDHKKDWWYHSGIILGYLTTDENFEFEFSNKCVPTQLKYLHQLQNLYYSLFGNELQIKDLNVAVSDTTEAK